MMLLKNIEIIGGGIVGLGCAWLLAKHGARVSLYEKNTFGSGASLAALGALMPYAASQTHQLAEQQRKSLALWPFFARQLELESGISPQYRCHGRLQPAYDPTQAQKLQQDAERSTYLWSVPQQFISADKIADDYADLAPTHGALWCPHTAWVNVRATVNALVAACTQAGVTLHKHTPVPSACHSETLRLICAGLGSNAFSEQTVVNPLKGECLLLKPAHPVRFKHMIRARGLYLIPRADGCVVVGATKEAAEDSQPTEMGRHTLLSKAKAVLPLLAEAEVAKHWAGVRPASTAPTPTIGWQDSKTYIATGHGGIGYCLLPHTAIKVTSDILALPRENLVQKFTAEQLG